MQFHITNWECPGRCSNLQTIVSVQEEMYKLQRRTGNNPVVVHCRLVMLAVTPYAYNIVAMDDLHESV